MKRYFISISLLGNVCIACHAQTLFNTIGYINKNNINASVLVHGDMWYDPADTLSACEFPTGSHKELALRNDFWTSGNDGNGALHTSAQTYREGAVDFWPGPYAINQDHDASEKWARIWKVDRNDLNTFLAISNHTPGNTPQDILEWPAKGNAYAKGNNGAALSITTDMAPFTDVNNDGIYNALQGDYPVMKGDQMLWWIFTDNGPSHNATNGTPVGIEVHATAYAYRRWTLIDNVVYYQYDVINESSNTYNNFRLGHFCDVDLGYPFDDYISYDSTWRMGITFNGSDTDGFGQTSSYGARPPVEAFTFVHVPDDAGNNYTPLGSFVSYHHDFSNNGDPENAAEFSNYMRLKYRDGTSYANNPYLHETFYECDSSNTPSDRSFILSTGDIVFNPGNVKTIVVALIVTDTGSNNTCPSLTMDGIRRVADTAWGVYNNPPVPNGVENVSGNGPVNIYPNPFSDVINVECAVNGTYVVYNSIGQKVMRGQLVSGKNAVVVNRQLSSGSYFIAVMGEKGDVIKKQELIKR